jgi:predicted kinase
MAVPATHLLPYATPVELELRYPPSSLVVVGGIPGAGKTTLLRRAFAGTPARVVDTDDVRERVQTVLGTRRGYALYRPLIHLTHWLRIRSALQRGGPVVVHETATRPSSRRRLARWARRHGRVPHLVLIDVDAAEALESQRNRGRRVCGRGRWTGTCSAGRGCGRGPSRVRRSTVTSRCPCSTGRPPLVSVARGSWARSACRFCLLGERREARWAYL